MSTNPADALTVQFLAWIAARPRTYKETMEAWRTSCPRLSIWEDAVRDGLVEIAPGERRSMKLSAVALTARGSARLAADGAGPPAQARTVRSVEPVR